MSASGRPNVLLVTVDHWPGVFWPAPERLQTHTLDRLALAGTRFPRAYSECPVCIPARRTLMTGTPPRVHGDRTFQTHLRMPALPTLAECFREAGYQCFAVGKLHVYPPRDRIGFDDVVLAEEGRPQYGWLDDYDVALGDAGFPGRQFLHGMSNNDYLVRTWHLPDSLHVTNWLTEQMCRTIRRRDPTRPAFWYLSYTHPHPPLVPLPFYWDMYADVRDGRTPLAIARPDRGEAPAAQDEPPLLRALRATGPTGLNEPNTYRAAIAGFMALCTHIDHQLRLVLGTLREEGILDRTAILFTSDHGDMLGRRDLWGKRLFYEPAANVPMLLVLPRGDRRQPKGATDDRLVGLQDVMPTLLDVAGLPVPGSVAGLSLLSGQRREFLYGEYGEGPQATRMVRDERYKLIYYAAGNRFELYDLCADPEERRNLADDAEHGVVLQRMQERLRRELYSSDRDFLDGDTFVGLPPFDPPPADHRDLYLQRGTHWPPPPQERRPEFD